jgi:hypothetical protein
VEVRVDSTVEVVEDALRLCELSGMGGSPGAENAILILFTMVLEGGGVICAGGEGSLGRNTASILVLRLLVARVRVREFVGGELAMAARDCFMLSMEERGVGSFNGSELELVVREIGSGGEFVVSRVAEHGGYGVWAPVGRVMA